MIPRRLIVFILLTVLAACSRGKQYEMRGQVLGVNREKAEVLVDQNGRNRTLSDIRDGRALALTFIYTTCPMPTFCPLMNRHFVEVQNQITAREPLRDQARLLSVSFDPAVDTPEVLKGHARQLGADPDVWTFVTGNRDDIDRFAMRLGLTLMRGQTADPKERAASVDAPSRGWGPAPLNKEIGHTLRTAVIDRNGKLVKVYTGNEWTPAQLVTDLESLR